MGVVHMNDIGPCVLCAAGGTPVDAPVDTWYARLVHVDDVLMVLVDSDDAVVVAPRTHVGSLSEDSEHAGDVLAALRNAALVLQMFYGASGATVQPVTEQRAAAGHVCYYVRPTFPTSARPVGNEQERLVAILQSHLALDTNAPRVPGAISRSGSRSSDH